jgi:hypothetical protein
VVTVVTGFLLAHFNVVPFGDGDADAAERYCVDESGTPCSYPPNGVRNAYRAGVLGPKQVKVPDVVEQKIRAAVHAKGPRFESRVKRELTWFEKEVWVMNCLPVVGMRQLNGERYPRCLTRKQTIRRVKDVKEIVIGCSQSALVTTFVGGSIAGKKGSLVGAIGGGVSCMVDDAITMMRTDGTARNWLPGPDGPAPGGGGSSW